MHIRVVNIILFLMSYDTEIIILEYSDIQIDETSMKLVTITENLYTNDFEGLLELEPIEETVIS